MTDDRPFVALGAPPRRQPTRAWRVRWTRDHWTLDADGYARWNHRWYVREKAANRAARRLHNSGALVEIDTYAVNHQWSVRWVEPDDTDCPF